MGIRLEIAFSREGPIQGHQVLTILTYFCQLLALKIQNVRESTTSLNCTFILLISDSKF
jgi:hypothetical protein